MGPWHKKRSGLVGVVWLVISGFMTSRVGILWGLDTKSGRVWLGLFGEVRLSG